MLISPVKKSPVASGLRALASNVGQLAGRKVWLPKIVYDALPYYYLTAGFAAFFATLYISDWFWVVPHYLLFSCACLHLAFKVSNMRRQHRLKLQGKPAADE